MSAAPRRLIAGNWKMNGQLKSGRAELERLWRGLQDGGRRRAEVVICPPATLIAGLREALKEIGAGRRIGLGGQDCHSKASGAHTGDISAEMLKEAGAAYVIVGHSERRADHGESDALVRAKVEAAHRAGLTAIVCVGETLEQRDAGQALKVVSFQLKRSLPDGATASNTVVAYEPVWAIGTGRTPTAGDVAKVHAHMRRRLTARFADANSFRLLYGGSVKASNAAELLGVANVDGALVGGASLMAADFQPIVEAAG